MAVDMEKLKQLREMTGAGMTECKKALESNENDIKRSVEWLHKQGLDRAAKYVDREAKVGRIMSYVHSTDSVKGKNGVLLELGCQTDFVARSPEFEELLKDICMQIAARNPRWISKEDVPAEELQIQRTKHEADVKGKPPEIAAKIIDGKLSKLFYAELCLLHQTFVNDTKFKGTVEDLIKTKSSKFGEKIEVRRFCRFELGVDSRFCERAKK